MVCGFSKVLETGKRVFDCQPIRRWAGSQEYLTIVYCDTVAMLGMDHFHLVLLSSLAF